MNKDQTKMWQALTKPLPKTVAQIREEIKARETPEYLAEQAARKSIIRDKCIAKAAKTIQERKSHLTPEQCLDKATVWYDTKANNS